MARMSRLADLLAYGRYALGLRRFLGEKETLESATARIKRNLARREPQFLALVERAVFANPRSPYLALFRSAGCTLDDVRRLLDSHGLDATLSVLRDAGVYVTFEEFKGRRPIVRDGREYPVDAGDFDSPRPSSWLQVETSGSSGRAIRVTHHLDFLQERIGHYLVLLAAYGILDAPSALWRGLLPDPSGLNFVLLLARVGHPPLRWFTPTWHGRWRDRRLLKFRVAHLTTMMASKAARARIPWPELVPVDEAARVAAWMADMLRRHGRCVTFTVPSRAVRVAREAIARGIDLTGATFFIAGEPVTPAKVSAIRESGARCMSTYGQLEGGRVGMGCREAADPGDVHVLADVCALIASPRMAGTAAEPLSALHLTVLPPTVPKVMINTELDDFGILETRVCHCPFGQLGLTTHLRNIRSAGKFTGEGVTLLESEMAHVVEEVLPRRFGGTAIDYQVLQEEDAHGIARVTLLVSPDIAIPSDADVIQTMLDALSHESLGAEAARQIWAQSGTLRVRRERPVATARGKLAPVYRPGLQARHAPER
jgi:hypothetical protein